jgi:RNA polymerase sigma factor (sigma-70 family)
VVGIARHQLAAYFRRGQVERRALARLGVTVSDLVDADLERVEELASLTELRKRVAGCLDELSLDHSEALRLRIVEERPYEEVATTLGLTEQAARARVSRALRVLRDTTDLQPEERLDHV